MNAITSKLAAIACTILLSSTMIAAAVGPAQAGSGAGAPNAVVSAARVA